MCDIFENRNTSYNLRSHTDLLKYLVTKVWDTVPHKIKSVENL